MNRSKIEWCDHTWNPITGCFHDCQYCYARRMSRRFSGDPRFNKMLKDCFTEIYYEDKVMYILDSPIVGETGNIVVYPFGFEPTLHRYRYDIPAKLKIGANIFVGAMADIFGDWVPDAWLDEIMGVCSKYPQHNYLWLTKNPARYSDYGVPAEENMWYGTTITTEREMRRFNELPAGCHTFVSLEPVLEDLQVKKHNIMFQQVDWFIIGAETGNRPGKVIPERQWIEDIIGMCRIYGKPVFMKNSLADIWEGPLIQEYPNLLMRERLSPKLKKKLYAYCDICKKLYKKNEMITLLARSQRGEQPKQYGFMCRECFETFLTKNDMEKPVLKIFERGGK